MPNNACNCCNATPPCTEGGIECVSVEASKSCSTCGHFNEDDNKYYKVKTTYSEYGQKKVETKVADAADCNNCLTEEVCSGTYTETITYEGGCVQTHTYGFEANSCTPTYDYSEIPLCDEPGSQTGSTTTVFNPPAGTPGPPAYTLPITDIEMPDLTFEAFPSWPSDGGTPANSLLGQSYLCSARHIQEVAKDSFGNITSKYVSQRKFKWRGYNNPTGTCYLKQWVKSTNVTAANPDAVPPTAEITTTTSAGTWEWNGTGNPCIPDPTKLYTDSDNIIYDAAEHLVDVPAVGVTKTVSLEKFSCVPNYEPNLSNPTTPNAYPCPDCEVDPP